MANKIHTQNPRIVLRLLVLADAPSIYAIKSLPSVHKYTLYTWNSPTDAETWIQNTLTNGSGSTFVIELTNDNDTPQLIGTIGMNAWNNIAYMLHPDFWGRGYASESLKAYVSFILNDRPGRRWIVAIVSRFNARSVATLKRCGFIAREVEDDGPTEVERSDGVSLGETGELSEEGLKRSFRVYIYRRPGLQEAGD